MKRLYVIFTTLLSILCISYIVYSERSHTIELAQKEREFNKLTEEVAELRIRYKKQTEIAKNFEKKFKEIKLTKEEKPLVVAESVYESKEKGTKLNAPTFSFTGKKVSGWITEVGYENGPPLGFVTYLSNGDIISRLYNHEIVSEYSLIKSEDGGYKVFSRTSYVLQSPTVNHANDKWRGVRYPLKVKDGEVQIVDTKKESRFEFHLSPSLSFNNNRFNLGASLFDFYTKDQESGAPKYKFLHVGLNFDENISKNSLTVTPIYVKIFDDICSDTYFGIGARANGNLFFSLNTTL